MGSGNNLVYPNGAVQARTPDHWGRRDFVRGMAALAGVAGLSVYDMRPAAADPPPEVPRIRLGNSHATCFAPQYIAEELLHLEGFAEIEYVSIDTGTGIDAMAEGRVDISMWDALIPLLTIDRGRPVVVLAGIHAGYWELFATERIRTIGDLRGRTVAVKALESGDHVLLASMLAYVGMDPRRDVKWVWGATYTDAMALFVQGKADAFMGFAPQPQELRAKGVGHVVVDTVPGLARGHQCVPCRRLRWQS